ncbi:MAG TPA: uroporphyrinogen decarboxylase family protein [Sedimentisphaerales bacterium]|nr:uroporphyrinogen decarboxylase family protein [Sedimentisphaerales bacterium]
MSYKDGWAAMNLEMPARVPRTEYSAHRHWELVKTVTGRDVSSESPKEVQEDASEAFMRAWNYDFFWSIRFFASNMFGDIHTKMGHATYASGGTDYSAEVTCPFKSPEEVLAFDPWQAYGRKDIAELARKAERQYSDYMNTKNRDGVNMTGIYDTCISAMIDIFGWDMMLLAAGTDMQAFGQVVNRYTDWVKQYFDGMAASNVPVVMVHDDIVWTSGAFLPPQWYRKYIFPNYRKLFAPLIEADKKIIYTSDGNYTEFVDDIAACGVHGFVMEPTTDMACIAEKYGRTHVFIGNADTRVLLLGTKDEIRSEVQRCMDIGKKYPGFFMAVGNHIPANTPVENALYYNMIYEELGRR